MLPILLETSQWLIVNKPSGMVMDGVPNGSPTVSSHTTDYLREQGNKNIYVGIVHRLDRVTTGAAIVAKKKNTLKLLNQLFRERQIQKTYLAITSPPPKEKTGHLTHYLMKDKEKRKSLPTLQPSIGNTIPSILDYEVLAISEKNHALIKVLPFTGHYHQIRAQLSAIGSPIIGDEKYGSSSPYILKSIALHAWQLSFKNPESLEPIAVKAPLPNNPFWKTFEYLFN